MHKFEMCLTPSMGESWVKMDGKQIECFAVKVEANAGKQIPTVVLSIYASEVRIVGEGMVALEQTSFDNKWESTKVVD